MNEILEMTINEMADASFDCSCGQHHTLGIKYMSIGKGTLPTIVDIAAPFKDKPVFMISDNHTFEAAGERTLKLKGTWGPWIPRHCCKVGIRCKKL